MPFSRIFCLCLVTLLGACTKSLPSDTESLKAKLTAVGEVTQATVERAVEVESAVGETVLKTGEVAKTGLEAVGNTVLEITGAASAPKDDAGAR